MQVIIHATITGREDTRALTVLMDGKVTLSGLHVACLRSINEQHPHEAGRPIVALKYDVRANVDAT